jgi:hypothetical protein
MMILRHHRFLSLAFANAYHALLLLVQFVHKSSYPQYYRSKEKAFLAEQRERERERERAMLIPLRLIATTAIANTIKMSTGLATTTTTTTTTIASWDIGTPGKPWGVTEIKQWRNTRVKVRSYLDDVVPRIESIRRSNEDLFDVVQYGELLPLTDDDENENASESASESCSSPFPLFAIKTKNWSKDKPNVLITGGVHGYETSGVEGALLFLESKVPQYSKHFNILVTPCISPWGYERIQRWTSKGVDPNRSFNPDGEVVDGRSFNPEAATEESAALIKFLREDMKTLIGDDNDWICHVDLHETTDSDETEFRPAKAARDGLICKADEKEEIPDGFYLVQDETSPMDTWFTAMIDSVRKVTHIAPTDKDGLLIGEKISQEGVCVIPSKKDLGLCAGVTDAPYRTTTEVYPDSPNATPEQCNEAQVACITGGLDHILYVLEDKKRE